MGEGNGTPLQYSYLANPMDGGAWWAAVHAVAKSRTRLRDFPFIFHFHALEKAMATHSSVLFWRIPGSGEPGGLLSIGSHRVRHDWNDLAKHRHKDFLSCYLMWGAMGRGKMFHDDMIKCHIYYNFPSLKLKQRTQVSCITGRFLIIWATREAQSIGSLF